MSLKSNLYIVANYDSVYSCLQQGIGCEHQLINESSSITLKNCFRVDKDGSEHPMLNNFKLEEYVRLFENCQEHLKFVTGNLEHLFIFEINGENILNDPEILRIRPRANLFETQYLRKLRVGVELIKKVHTYSLQAKVGLQERALDPIPVPVEVNPNLFTKENTIPDVLASSIVKANSSSEPTHPNKKIDLTILNPFGSNVTIEEGNLFESGMQTLVNTVNCVGVMGKGIALSFKQKFPNMFLDYSNRCKKGEVKLGKPYVFNLSDGRKIINFPTKNHWNENSKMIFIEQGLQYLIENISQWGIKSLAIPPLGCGNGKLNWCDIQLLMLKYLSSSKIRVKIYAPYLNNSFSKKRSLEQSLKFENLQKKQKSNSNFQCEITEYFKKC